jgi:hypothetical protein
MILEALEIASRGHFAEEVEIKSPLTVEHVLPQGAHDTDWPLEQSNEETETDARLRRSDTTQSLGNLTLLTQPLNSAVSNGPYSEKRPEITKQSLLALNSYFQNALQWNESAIKARGSVLADEAIKTWPGP